MNYLVISRILGMIIILFSATFIPAIIVSVIYDDQQFDTLLQSMALVFFIGLIVWLPARNHERELRVRDGFLLTALFWSLLGICGSLPFYLSKGVHLSGIDALFESISGITTTGASVIQKLDGLPPSLLWYRQQLQWLGGLGIIIFAIAVLPMLGIGGMQLYRSGSPGSVKDNRLKPRITESAKSLSYVYLILTVLCAIAYWFSGMSLFDAIGHSFSTISLGGFSSHSAGLAYFDSAIIEVVAMSFILLSGVSFTLHYLSFRNISFSQYKKDPEFRFYIFIILGLTLISIMTLLNYDTYDLPHTILRGAFTTINILTTAGFTNEDLTVWPQFLPYVLWIGAFVGACAGSTGGGLKMIRVLLVFKQVQREMKMLIHPNAIIPVKLGHANVSSRVLEAVWGFLSVYLAVVIVLIFMILLTGVDIVSAWSAVSACMNNLGPGLGEAAKNYNSFPTEAKAILIIAMLLGRMELFTLLVLFTPVFWKR